MRRLVTLLITLGAVALSTLTSVSAQDYPNRPIRLIVPYTTGGGGYTLAQLLSEALEPILKQKIVIESRPGTASLVGTQYVKNAAPDGYTILLAYSALTVNSVVFPNANYDPVKDFTPIAQLIAAPHMLVATPSLKVQSVPELVELAKKKPGQLNFGSVGVGSSNHLNAELLKRETGIDIVHVPYQGGAAFVTDILAGRLDMVFGTISSLKPHADVKAMVPLAVTGTRRFEAVKDVPTFQELGIKGLEALDWGGLFAPAGVDPAIVTKLSDAVGEALKQPALLEKMIKVGLQPSNISRDEFVTLIANDPFAKIASELNIKIEQ